MQETASFSGTTYACTSPKVGDLFGLPLIPDVIDRMVPPPKKKRYIESPHPTVALFGDRFCIIGEDEAGRVAFIQCDVYPCEER